jgi:hypothetical protein
MVTPIVIPAADAPERKEFDGTIIGTLDSQDGGFSCLECRPLDTQEHPIRVYGINVSPYSVVCHRCNALVVDGAKMAKDNVTPLCLYDPPTTTS